jgi:hypothetical protein
VGSTFSTDGTGTSFFYVVQSLTGILGNGAKIHQGRKDVVILVSNPIENYWGIEEDADAIPRSSDDNCCS